MSPSNRQKSLYAMSYVVVFLGMITLGWLVAKNFEGDAASDVAVANQRAADAVAYADQLCEANAETRQVTIDIAAALSRDQPIPADADPELRGRIQRSNEAKAAVRAVVAELSRPDACADGIAPPSRLDEFTPDSGTTTTTTP